MSTCDFKNLDPNDISEHPLLANIPLLSADKYEVLKQSIAEIGIQIPVTCIHGKGDQYVLIGGRHRLKAAKELHLQRIPAVIQADGEDILKFILDTTITGRQLTKTGICLLLMEKHPDLIKDRESRKAKALKIGLVARVQSMNTENDSFRSLAKTYKIPFQYFTWVLEAMELCRAKSRDMDRIRHMVFFEEVCANRLASSLRGWQAEHLAGTKIGDEDVTQEVKNKSPVNIQKGLFRSIMFVRNQGQHWLRMTKEQDLKCREMWRETIVNLPKDILEITKEAATEAIKKLERDNKK
jgi:uncharacterized ParB-like nuclease family protein